MNILFWTRGLSERIDMVIGASSQHFCVNEDSETEETCATEIKLIPLVRLRLIYKDVRAHI